MIFVRQVGDDHQLHKLRSVHSAAAGETKMDVGVWTDRNFILTMKEDVNLVTFPISGLGQLLPVSA